MELFLISLVFYMITDWRKMRSHINLFKFFICVKKDAKGKIAADMILVILMFIKASFAKHLRSKMRLEKKKRNDMIEKERFFQEIIAN